MLGSLVYVGGMTPSKAYDIAGIDTVLVTNSQELLRRPAPCPWAPKAFVELHIEQGPVLEAEGITIGAVTVFKGLAGPSCQ